MTNKEAIEILRLYKEAFDLAIKALELTEV